MVHQQDILLVVDMVVLKAVLLQAVVVMDQETLTVDQEEQILVAVAVVLTEVQAIQVVQAVQVS
jgi:hypothetical protein